MKTFSLNIKLAPRKLQSAKLSSSNHRKIKKSLDQGGEYAALLMDLSKAFDCLLHDLIIAKLHTYEFGKAPLRLMHNELEDTYHRVKIKNSYSLRSLIKYGVPLGILPRFWVAHIIQYILLFNIFLCDMFFIFMINTKDIASYADDNTPYSVGKNRYNIETKLQKASVKGFN